MWLDFNQSLVKRAARLAAAAVVGVLKSSNENKRLVSITFNLKFQGRIFIQIQNHSKLSNLLMLKNQLFRISLMRKRLPRKQKSYRMIELAAKNPKQSSMNQFKSHKNYIFSSIPKPKLNLYSKLTLTLIQKLPQSQFGLSIFRSLGPFPFNRVPYRQHCVVFDRRLSSLFDNQHTPQDRPLDPFLINYALLSLMDYLLF